MDYIVRPGEDTTVAEWAEKKYKEIRECSNDIEKIAENTGVLKDQIKRIKDHLFHDEHILRGGVIGQLGADAEIAAAWDRLYQGDYIKNDIRLLEHGLLESVYEKTYNTDYDTAHDAAQNPDYGKPWSRPIFRK